MTIDASIPLQTSQTNPMSMLSSVLGVKDQQQKLQAGRMSNQQAGIDLQERQGVQGVLSHIKDFQDSAGNIDFGKLGPEIMSVAPTTGTSVLNKVAVAQTAATGAKSAVTSLNQSKRSIVANMGVSMQGQDPAVVINSYNKLGEADPELKPFTDYAVQYHLAPSANDPKAFDKQLDMLSKGVLSAQTQQTMNTPQGVAVNDNRTTKVVSTAPNTIVPPGQVISGTEATLQPGPNTTTVGPDGTQGIVGTPQADFSGVRGPQRGAILADIAAREPGSDNAREAVNALSGRPQGFIPSSLPVGQAQNIGNNVDEMNRHFGGLQDQAAGAQLVSGLTGNIKALASKAITGTGSDKLAYANGLIATFLPGEHKVDDLKTATDLLDKNVAQLALGTPGGRTDAAMALIGAARPNAHMTPEADQVASQVRANMAMRNALQGYKMMGDYQGYANARQKLEQIADPRVFQFESADAAGRAKMLSNLTPDDKAQLRTKIQAAEQMGLVQ